MKGVASILLGLLILLPADVRAQSEGRIAVGGNVTSKQTPQSGSHGSTGGGVLWRIGHGHDGWGWKYGLNWYSAELQRLIGGQNHEFGELNVRPFMGGYGYTRTIRHAKVSTNLLAGFALTSFSVRDAYAVEYRVQNAGNSLETDVSSAWVLKPEVSAWFDVTRKVGINVSAGYMVARPQLTITSTAGQDRRRLNADVIMIKAGVVYSIF